MKEWVRKAQHGDGDAFILDISTLYGHSKADAPSKSKETGKFRFKIKITLF